MSTLDRRRFLKGSLTTLGATGIGAAVGAGVAQAGDDSPAPATPTAAGRAGQRALAGARESRSTAIHQSGIVTPPADQATFLALDSIAPNRAGADRGAAGALRPRRAG